MNWYSNFFLTGPIPLNAMYGVYNPYLVALSYIIASMASFVALDMSTHLRKPETFGFFLFWLIGGAIIMGAGIWFMHFVGMLAFIMPMEMSYNLFWTGLSMFVAIVTAFIAFTVFKTKEPKLKHYLLSGIILGAAIPTMHYTGMAGMNGVKIHYQIGLFSLSIIIAIIAATVALWLVTQGDKGSFKKQMQLKVVSALIMGLAIVGMHYTGMAAAIFIPTETIGYGFHLSPFVLSGLIATVVISIMIVAVIVSFAKYFLDKALRMKNDFLEAILNNMDGGVVACDAKGKITLFNHAIKEIAGPVLRKVQLENWMKDFPLYTPRQ